MGFFEFVERSIKKDWSVLKQAKTSLAIITLLALSLGGYGGFRVTDYVLRERNATLQTMLDAERQKHSQASATQLKGRVLVGYGAESGVVCMATINLAVLIEFQDKYDALVVCGLVDQTVDRMTDKRTSLSPPFVIRREVAAATWQLSPEMAEGQNKLAAPVREQLRKMKIPESLGLTAVTNKWYEVILLPKGTNQGEIRSLLDATYHGGKLLAQEGYEAGAISIR